MSDASDLRTDSNRTASPGILLIGTVATCRQLSAQLGALATPARTLGWIVAEDAGPATSGEPVIGGIGQVEHHLAKFEGMHAVALVSLPRQHRAAGLRVSAALRRFGIVERLAAPIDEILSGIATPTSSLIPSSPDYAALIGRTPYGIDRKAVARLIEGRRVLITGAGGSIGSEISRIVASFSPERIILMERSENSLFEIDRRIASRFPGLSRAAVLHDVVDAEATLRKLREFKPHVVFHAAAHKHVPLMEDHPSHAVNNNFFGTKSIADASLAVGAERFVLISSDKAVKPTSVMGATKRLAEMYIQGLHRSVWSRRQVGAGRDAGTAFCMVRFGNVLGSACSVLPIWASQLAEGGPVTVTDPRMTRYFMTIDEAAALVIQAGAIENPEPTARVYVLDMGEPVRILELAQRFVRAAGFAPRAVNASGQPVEAATIVDGSGSLPEMAIQLTGARPGEKLHEELAYAAELLRPTPYPGINAWAGPLGDDFSLAALVGDLGAVRTSTSRDSVLDMIRLHVPELPASHPTAGPRMDDSDPSLSIHPSNIRTDYKCNPNKKAAIA